MIFQLPLDLDVENKNVQAIIDLDTGFIGFTESINKKTEEYRYGESPVEFKKALFKKLEPMLAEKSLTNFKICRKNEKMKSVSKLFRDKDQV